MTNIERVIEAIQAGHDHIDAISEATGICRVSVHGAISNLRDSGRIERHALVPRTERHGHPQVRYRLTESYRALLEARDAIEQAQQAIRDAKARMRRGRRGYSYRDDGLRQQVGMFAGLLV